MAGNLLEIHAFIWFINGDEALSSKALETIEKHPDSNYVSMASLWEIADYRPSHYQQIARHLKRSILHRISG